MCLVPRSALAVLEAMDGDPNAALIDQREKEAYSALRNRGCEREAEGAEEDREGFESSAGSSAGTSRPSGWSSRLVLLSSVVSLSHLSPSWWRVAVGCLPVLWRCCLF